MNPVISENWKVLGKKHISLKKKNAAIKGSVRHAFLPNCLLKV